MIKEAIILAGGFGTRLAHIVNDVPKPMASVAGLPFLTFILNNLQKAGINHVILCTGYKSHIISDYYGNSFSNVEDTSFSKLEHTSYTELEDISSAKLENINYSKLKDTNSSKLEDINCNKLKEISSAEIENTNFTKLEEIGFSKLEDKEYTKVNFLFKAKDLTKINYSLETKRHIDIDYSIEDKPLGTGGAVKAALNKLQGDEFFLLNGDTFFDIDYNEFFNEYIKNPSLLYLALSEQKDTSRYGTVIIDDKRNVLEFCEKGNNSGYGLINGGIYLINKTIFSSIDTSMCFSFENEILEKHYKDLNIKGFKFNSYFIDIGIPKDYFKAQKHFSQRKQK